ncbi:hypothetical protein JXL83_09550 [candidate division WOR-3 bacterium]|nr:hypothetical protein [candidate division WOR-3 bacterium]
MNFVRSVSGYRGIVGDGFDPDVVVRYTNAFARFLGDGAVCIGRDPRKSGGQFAMIAAGSLMSSGRDVTDFGIVTTPTVLINVKKGGYAGAVIVTASHNPEKWNALKFVKKGGVFLNSDDIKVLFDIVDSKSPVWSNHNDRGAYQEFDRAEKTHLDALINSEWFVKCSGIRVVIDTAGGASSTILPELCAKMDCDILETLGGGKDGNFTRELEPVPENLKELSKTVAKHGNTVGLATDTDGDRLALVDEDGIPVGEERTLQLAVLAVLEKEKGPVVTNVSTSSAVKIIAEKEGCAFFMSPVGEGKVVDTMFEKKAVIGGEGNGGVIFPSVHPARDAQTAVLLILGYLKKHGMTLKEAVKKLPSTHMIKNKIDDFEGDIQPSLFEGVIKNAEFVGIDGIRWQNDTAWFHVRKSGTEKAIRLIVETQEKNESEKILFKLTERLRKCAV